MNKPVGILKITAILVFVFICLFFIWLIRNKTSNTIFVANNGIDSNACGKQTNPCRSISRAIALASEGYTVKIGPGVYGDLNKNGILGEPGEEFTQGYTMINIDKAVKLISSDGPLKTVLDANNTSLNVVSISANNVIFGLPKHGFSIIGAKANGLSTTTVSNITVAGNHAVGNAQGGIVVNGNTNLLQENFSSGNVAAGIAVFGTGNEVRSNVSMSNGSQGYVIVGSKHVIRSNLASNNATGFGVQGTEIKLAQNAAIGNRYFGISLDTPGANATIDNNNIYGNNNVALNGLENCGIQNASGSKITATDNFWGASSGPGPDPADNAGNLCDVGGSKTNVIPFTEKIIH